MANNDGGIAYERVGGTRLAAADEDSSSAAVFVDPFAEAAPVFDDDGDEAAAGEGLRDASDPFARRAGPAGAASSSSFSSSSSSSSSLPPGAFGHLSDLDLAHALGVGGGASRLPSASDALRLGAPEGERDELGGGARHRLGGGDRPMLVQERRGLWGACSYNIGYAYFGGLFAGGCFGVVQGLRTSPNAQPRILLNSVLNASGKFGARAGNAAGVLSLLFTVTERQLEDLELDKLPGALNDLAAPLTGGRDLFRRQRAEGLVPLATAFATGAMFTLPRAASMRGVDRLHVSLLKRGAVCLVGGLACTAGVGALSVLAPLLLGAGRSPFRFA